MKTNHISLSQNLNNMRASNAELSRHCEMLYRLGEAVTKQHPDFITAAQAAKVSYIDMSGFSEIPKDKLDDFYSYVDDKENICFLPPFEECLFRFSSTADENRKIDNLYYVKVLSIDVEAGKFQLSLDAVVAGSSIYYSQKYWLPVAHLEIETGMYSKSGTQVFHKNKPWTLISDALPEDDPMKVKQQEIDVPGLLQTARSKFRVEPRLAKEFNTFMLGAFSSTEDRLRKQGMTEPACFVDTFTKYLARFNYLLYINKTPPAVPNDPSVGSSVICKSFNDSRDKRQLRVLYNIPIRSFDAPKPVKTIKDINYRVSDWGVRGHTRRLASGREIYIKAHQAHRHGKKTGVKVVKTDYVVKDTKVAPQKSETPPEQTGHDL